MRSLWFLSALVAWVGSVAAVAYAGADCDGRVLLASDGTSAGLDDCDLAELLEVAGLREHLKACVEEAGRQRTRVYGTLRFNMDLHPGGGVTNLRLPRSAFDRTCFPDCLSRVLKRRLAGPGQGKPAAIKGHFTVSQSPGDPFGFSLSGMLAPPPSRKPQPLQGRFERTGAGLLSSCELGKSRLFVRLDPTQESEAMPWEGEQATVVPVQVCLAIAEPVETNGRARRKMKKRSARSIKREVTACLVGLLDSANWDDRAAAAEELARGWRWRGRSAIKRAVVEAMTDPACKKRAGSSNGKVARKSAKSETCPLEVPGDLEAGLALTRMVKAHLRLRRLPADGVLDSLALHPRREVRLFLLKAILARWHRGVPEGLDHLVLDSDPAVRARAQQVGCERSDWASLRAFKASIRHADPAMRANAVLHARACARKAQPAVLESAADESNPALALLMLRSIPTPSGTFLLEKAGAALFDPCPLVRYLGARLLFRLPELPDHLIKQALEREPDPVLLGQLKALTRRSGALQQDRTEHLWLQ